MNRNAVVSKQYLYTTFVALFTCTLLFGCLRPFHNTRKGGSQTAISDDTLKIMTYNIRVGCARDNLGLSPYLCMPKMDNLRLVAEAIRSEDPDVVALQEVKGFRQAKFLADLLNMNFSYVGHSGSISWWGLAVLSKFEISESTSDTIHEGNDTRAAQVATIKVDGRQIDMVNVHYFLGDYESQVSSTLKIASELKNPVILLGDFNRIYIDYVMEPVHHLFVDTCRAVSTENSKLAELGTGYARIDYIFVQKDEFSVIDAGTVLGRYWKASDHLAYYTIVSVHPEMVDLGSQQG